MHMQSILLPAEVEWVVHCDHGPNACTLMLSRLVSQLDLPLFRSVEVDQNITRLIDVYGGCERIMKTPVPLSYTRYAISQSLQWLKRACCKKARKDYAGRHHSGSL